MQNGRTGHSLYDSASGLQQDRIGDLNHEIPAVCCAFGENFCDLNPIFPDLISADIGENCRRAQLHLVPLGHRDCLLAADQAFVCKGPKHAAVRIGPELAQIVGHLKCTLELSRCPGDAFLHLSHLSVHNGAVLQRHQQGGVNIADSVSQRAEGPGGRLVKGHGADSRHGIANPRAQLVAAVGGALHCLRGHLHLLLPAQRADAHCLALQLLEHSPNFFN